MEVKCKDICHCCETCQGCLGFQKILDLKNAGLVIYRHTNRVDEVNKTTGLLKSSVNTMDDIFIIHNTKDTQIKVEECITEIDQNISCARCRELVQRAKKYLRDVPHIKKNDIISVCEHCQQNKIKRKSLNYCYKCHEILKKYNSVQIKHSKAKEQIETWLSKVQKMFENIITDKRSKKSLKCRSYSELYLNSMAKNVLCKRRHFDVGPMLEKGVKILTSVRSFDNDALGSESAVNKSAFNSEYIKSKSVLMRAESLINIGGYVSSGTTYDTLGTLSGRKEEERKPTGLPLVKGILQRNIEYTPQFKIKSIESSQKLKKYHSEEDLFFSIGAFRDLDENKNFSFIFPKEISDNILPLRKVKTSAELITDTQKMLHQRAIDLKNKQDERNIHTAIKTHREKTNVVVSDKAIKSQDIEIIHREKPDKPADRKTTIKENKNDKEIIARDKKKQTELSGNEKECKQYTGENRTDKKAQRQKEKEDGQKVKQLRKEEEDKQRERERLRKEEDKQREKERLQKEKEEKQREKEQQRKEKEEKQKEKQEQIRKEHELKQKLKDSQQAGKEEKVKKKDDKDIKSDKVEKTENSEYTDNLKRMLEQQKTELSNIKKQQDQNRDKLQMEADRKSKESTEQRLKPLNDTNIEKKPDREKPKADKKQDEPTTKELNIKHVKMRRPSPDDLILQLVKLRQIDKKDVKTRPLRLSEINITPLMVTKHNKMHKGRKTLDCAICVDSDVELDVETIVNAKPKQETTDMIIGEKILKSKYPITEKGETEQMIPILYKTIYKEDMPPQQHPENIINLKDRRPLTPSHKYGEQELPKGIIRYALSDRSFIDKGWTMLPTEKVVRKMNVYRMRPAHPEFDWFDRNKNKKLMLYDTGEKLAEFNDNGRGRWFYRNGRLALDYYDAEEMNAQQRFVIYGSGEPDERGRYQPVAILATFDYLGNGVVFDHTGKIRLKFNQTEGVVLDRSIGPVSHWKWHTLNDPPVLQQVMIDTQMAHKDPDILKLGGPGDDKVRPDNEEMLAIEFDNFIKEKSKKLSQKFKPFQIRTKALKINENFSLRVLDQANIYLIFRDGTTNIKMNIGMILDHQEIVDTDTAEVGEVSNNLERFPARTDSLAGLQRSVAHAQRVERLRLERERRLRHPEPNSADKLVTGASRPLKPQLLTVPSSSTIPKDECNCKCRKPSFRNVYYDTRFI